MILGLMVMRLNTASSTHNTSAGMQQARAFATTTTTASWAVRPTHYACLRRPRYAVLGAASLPPPPQGTAVIDTACQDGFRAGVVATPPPALNPRAIPRARCLQDASDNVVVAVSRTKPTACPYDMAAADRARNRATATADCSGNAVSAVVDVGNVCTSERTNVYLWVRILGAQTVRGLGFGVWGFGAASSARGAYLCGCAFWGRAGGEGSTQPGQAQSTGSFEVV